MVRRRSNFFSQNLTKTSEQKRRSRIGIILTGDDAADDVAVAAGAAAAAAAAAAGVAVEE